MSPTASKTPATKPTPPVTTVPVTPYKEFVANREIYVNSEQALENEKALFQAHITANPGTMSYERKGHQTLMERLSDALKDVGYIGGVTPISGVWTYSLQIK